MGRSVGSVGSVGTSGVVGSSGVSGVEGSVVTSPGVVGSSVGSAGVEGAVVPVGVSVMLGAVTVGWVDVPPSVVGFVLLDVLAQATQEKSITIANAKINIFFIIL